MVAIVLFDTIMHQELTPMEFKRSRSFGDIGQRSPVSCLSIFSKGFFSETAKPISFKFHMQPPSKGGKKICIYHLGHMTKMAAMPIYGKNLIKSSCPEPLSRLPSNFVCSISGVIPLEFE